MKSGMYDPYERVKGGRLAFKGGDLATRIEKKSKKKRKKKNKKEDDISNNPNLQDQGDDEIETPQISITTEIEGEGEASSGSAYTIDAAKRMKYEQLFPVEAKKFGYQPKADFKSVEDALDDRVKKKADRYCKWWSISLYSTVSQPTISLLSSNSIQSLALPFFSFS